jgi:hypothetical protein
MCLTFGSRQFDHAVSVQLLEDHRDMGLITRTMLEGMVLLLWASKGKPIRPKQWMDFVRVHDWRLLNRHRREGVSVDDTEWKEVLDHLDRCGRQFYTHKSKECERKGLPLPIDPFRNSWIEPLVVGNSENKRSWKKLFEEVGLLDLYSSFYSPLAAWFHWDASSALISIQVIDQGIAYSSVRPDDSFYAILACITGLHVVAQLLDQEMQLGLSVKLEEYRLDFYSWSFSFHAPWQIPKIN